MALIFIKCLFFNIINYIWRKHLKQQCLKLGIIMSDCLCDKIIHIIVSEVQNVTAKEQQ
ncbi:hypothetical protein pb186bvf_017476 [Paramecium bursaria]